jgi:RNA 2',3'-cyclic 3'-phosphodiesterase
MAEKQLRLFVAAYPPADAANAMLGALAALEPAPDPPHRRTPVDQVHLTLQFIGGVDERSLPVVIESVKRSVSGLAAFELTPRRLVSFPERGTPRLIAMETDAPPELLEVQRRLALRLARQPRRAAGDKFRPHLTLARFSGLAHPERVDQPVELAPFRVGEVMLMRSRLHSDGARHVELGRASLV